MINKKNLIVSKSVKSTLWLLAPYNMIKKTFNAISNTMIKIFIILPFLWLYYFLCSNKF